MLMSSGIYRTRSFQDRYRAIGLRRPASVNAQARSGSSRAPKRRTVSGGEVIRTPSRIESMPNMHNGAGADVPHRSVKRRERAVKSSMAVKCSAVDGSRKLRAKSSTVRYSATKGADAGDDHATPPTTSGSSSVVVDIEATPKSSVVGRTGASPPQLRPHSPISERSADITCLQSPVNNSGVRIVIDSDDDDDDDDDRLLSLTDAEFDATRQQHFPDGPETAATSGSASVTSGSGDEDSSNAVVVFQCGPSDDAEEGGISNLLSVMGQP